MEKSIEPIKTLWTSIKEDFLIDQNLVTFEIFPQMPKKQIDHFVKQAADRRDDVIIQLNPSPFTNQTKEVLGTVSLSPTSDHIILKTKSEEIIHLLQVHSIRHLRLV